LIPGLMDAHVHILNERNLQLRGEVEGVPTLKMLCRC